jgi:hypothetical protein
MRGFSPVHCTLTGGGHRVKHKVRAPSLVHTYGQNKHSRPYDDKDKDHRYSVRDDSRQVWIGEVVERRQLPQWQYNLICESG